MIRCQFSSAESRLLNVTADPNAVKYTRRTAAANASLQSAAHQSVVAANQAAGQPLQATSAADPNAVTAAKLRATQMATAPMVDQFRNPTAAGVMNQAQRTASIPGQTTYSMETGAVTQGGQINAGAADRLINNGMSVTEAQNRIDANQPDIQRTMSNTGLGGTARKSAVEKSAAEVGQEAYDNVMNKYAVLAQTGGSIDQVAANKEANQAKSDAITAHATDSANKRAEDQKIAKKQDESAASSVAKSANDIAPSPEATGLEAALAGLPPEYQALAPLFQGLIGSIEQGQADLATGTKALLDANQTASEKIDANLAKAESTQIQTAEKIQGMLDNLQEKQEANLTKQENAAKERLEITRMEQEQRISVERRQAKESKIAEMAVKNRMGSDGALRELDEADQFYQKQWQNLQLEVGVQRTELAAKFSGLFLESENKHTLSTVENIKDALGALERIGTQKNANTRARADAETSILQTMLSKQVDLRKELAKEKLNIGGQIIGVINQSRDDKRAQEQLGWQRLQWVTQTYGSNAPQALLDSIGKQLPGVDVRSVASQMTLAEMKKKAGSGSGSSGGGPSFTASERSSSGKPLSLDSYLSQKESEWRKSTGISGVAPPADAKKRWENEYKAKEAEEKVYSPDAIWKDWLVKQAQAGNFSSVTQMESTGSAIKSAIDGKDYDLARKLVDEIGAKPPEKTIDRVSNLQRLESDLSEMESLVGEIEQNIGPFPTEGPLWTWMNENIETTTQYQRMKQLRDSNLAAYARGVSGDKGATTENDAARAVSSLIDANVSGAALKAAIQNAKKQTKMARTIYLDNMRKGGYRVNALQTGTEAETPIPSLTPEQNSFLNKF